MKKILLLLLVYCSTVEISNAQSKKSKGNTEPLIGVNLVKNPGAEKLTTSNKLLYWKTNLDEGDYFSSYGHTSGEWDYGCDKKCGLPENAGSYYFRAPADIAEGENDKSLEQTIDISQLKDTLATRVIKFSLSAQIAGFHCVGHSKCAFGYIKIEFRNAANLPLKSFESRKYTYEFNRMDATENGDSRMNKFEKISLSDTIPPAAARAILTIGALQNCQQNSDTYCDAAFVFFDNLNLEFTKQGKR